MFTLILFFSKSIYGRSEFKMIGIGKEKKKNHFIKSLRKLCCHALNQSRHQSTSQSHLLIQYAKPIMTFFSTVTILSDRTPSLEYGINLLSSQSLFLSLVDAIFSCSVLVVVVILYTTSYSTKGTSTKLPNCTKKKQRMSLGKHYM